MRTEIKKIKNLRTRTGLSLEEIKKALAEAEGDEDRAAGILKIHGAAIAAKKASRQVKEGIVEAYVHATKKLGVIVEVLCETDFVARNAEFQKLAHDIAMHIAAMKPTDADELLKQPFIKDQDISVQELLNQHISKLGENIQIGQYQILEL